MENIKTLDKIVVGRRPVTTNNLWVDTTKGNPFIKVYKNGEWVAIDDVTREEVDWIKDEIHRLTDLTPEELDTLKEVADKLIEIEGKFDDYMPLTGGVMTGEDEDLKCRLSINPYVISAWSKENDSDRPRSVAISGSGINISDERGSVIIDAIGIVDSERYLEYSDILTKTALLNSDLKIGSEDNKKSLEVYGTTRLKGELKLSKSVTGEDINVKGVKSLAAHTITTDSEIKAASVRVDSSLTVGGETNLNGSLNMNGNDINNVQSVDVSDTGRFDTVKTHILKGNEDGKPLLIKGDVEFENPISSSLPVLPGTMICKDDDYEITYIRGSLLRMYSPGDITYDSSIYAGSLMLTNVSDRIRAEYSVDRIRLEDNYIGGDKNVAQINNTSIRFSGYGHDMHITHGTIYNKGGLTLKDDNNTVTLDDLFFIKTIGVEIPITEMCVDLGLPSGLLWATCNIGAEREYDYGKYFQWGDVEGRTADELASKLCTWSTCPFNNGSKSFDEAYFTAHKSEWLNGSVLKPEYDAATLIMGEDWRMPTKAEYDELMANTTNVWTTINGVYGRKFTSKKDSSKYIFIPAAGKASGDLAIDRGGLGDVWNSSYNTSSLYSASVLHFNSKNCGPDSEFRCYGIPVRGVTSAPPTKTITVKKNIYTPLKDVIEENEQITAAALVDLNNKLQLATPKMIHSTANTTVSGYQVPQLTADDVTEAYNAIIAGRAAIVVDKDEQMHAYVNQADSLDGNVSIGILYYSYMLLTYTLEGDNVTITTKEIS